MKRADSEIVHFSFMCKTYYRDVALGAPELHECKGLKTLKLFKSWFRLMKNKNRLLYGVVTFSDGEAWIWQSSKTVYNAGWKLAKRPPKQMKLF